MKRFASLASVLVLLALVPSGAVPGEAPSPAARKMKRLRCYQCKNIFSVPADQYEGVCPNCGARFVIPGGPIPWTDAKKYMGQEKTVTGTVVGTHLSPRSKKFYMNLHQNYNEYGSIAIPPETQKSFPSPLSDYFMNKRIKVRGKIGTYRNRPEILVKDPSQLQIIP